MLPELTLLNAKMRRPQHSDSSRSAYMARFLVVVAIVAIAVIWWFLPDVPPESDPAISQKALHIKGGPRCAKAIESFIQGKFHLFESVQKAYSTTFFRHCSLTVMLLFHRTNTSRRIRL